LTSSGCPPLAFRSSPEFWRSAAVAFVALARTSGNYHPCGSFPLRRFPSGGQLLTPQRLPAFGLRCLLSVSHALKAFFRPPPPGLISCRSRPWGLPFRVFRRSRSVLLFRASCPLVVSSLFLCCVHCGGFLSEHPRTSSHSAVTYLMDRNTPPATPLQGLAPRGRSAVPTTET
jgi:hypothetical protein